MRPGSSRCAEHRIDRPAASVTGSGSMVREPDRRERAFRRGQPICRLSRPQGCKSLLCAPLDLAAAPFPFQLTKGRSMFRARERDGSRQRMGRRSRGCPTRVTPAGAAGRCPPTRWCAWLPRTSLRWTEAEPVVRRGASKFCPSSGCDGLGPSPTRCPGLGPAPRGRSAASPWPPGARCECDEYGGLGRCRVRQPCWRRTRLASVVAAL